MTHISITSWNINSVRIRLNMIEHFIEQFQPDFLCLQEIKCETKEFPFEFFKDKNYFYQHVFGQKGLHGVAILSKQPFEAQPNPEICPKGEARHAHIKTEQFDLYNFYVPAGGDIPDPQENEKFAHKLNFIRNMTDYFKDKTDNKTLIVGDFNIAPEEHDVWSHKQLLKIVSHTPIEVEHLQGLKESGGFYDLARHVYPELQKLYSWWSYRARDWKKSNRGRRLDHIWLTKALKNAFNPAPQSFIFHESYRGFERPSDHVPITVKLDL